MENIIERKQGLKDDGKRRATIPCNVREMMIETVKLQFLSLLFNYSRGLLPWGECGNVFLFFKGRAVTSQMIYTCQMPLNDTSQMIYTRQVPCTCLF